MTDQLLITMGMIMSEISREPNKPKPAKKAKACGNPNCGISSGYFDDEITFGSGNLSFNGYWEHPCLPCAQAWKANNPDDAVWPEDDSDLPPPQSNNTEDHW